MHPCKTIKISLNLLLDNIYIFTSFYFFFVLQQETAQLLVCTMLLGDFATTLLTLVQFYWISVGAFLIILLIPPLSLLSPFLAGLNAIFSRGPKRSSLTRIYALWNATSIVNTVSVPFWFVFGTCKPLIMTPYEMLKCEHMKQGLQYWLIGGIYLGLVLLYSHVLR